MNDPHFFGPVKTRCPKCRSIDLTAREVTEASMLFDIVGGVMTRLPYSEDFDGIIGVSVTCKKCRHAWRPRGAHQVTDLLKVDALPALQAQGEKTREVSP